MIRANLLCALVALSAARAVAADSAGAPVEFNPAFLQGGAKLDVSRFSRGNPVLPGEYLVDLQINGSWVGRSSVRFIGQPNSDVALPCIDRALFDQIGLDLQKLSPSARSLLQQAGSGGCLDLAAMVEDASVSFELSQLQLNVSVPQASIQHQPRGYVGPELWDSGVPSATLGYNLNAYRYTNYGQPTTKGHVDLTTGINYGSWHLRQRSAIEVASDGPATYQSIATYLAHDIPAIRSDLTVGDNFTDGAVFDGFGFRGVSLASNDQMLPDSQLEFAPVVRGMAHTNARVVITQNGITILETTVSPGAFEIDDLYATGYGGDLNVAIHEADGSQESFIVPYGSMAQLLRPGVWRYTAAAGELQLPTISGSELFAQATLQHGFNSYLTSYAGAVGAEHYQAALLGIAVNTAVGAIAADVQQASAAITAASSFTGQSLRFSYSKLLHDTGTNIALAAYRFSSKGFYSFVDAESTRQVAQSGDPDTVERARSQWQVSINQTLASGWGSFYLTTSVRDYWNSSRTTTQLQGGYTNHLRLGGTRLSYGLSAARQNNMLTGKPDNRVQVNFSLPLGHSAGAPMFSASLTQSSTGDTRTRGGQEVLTGTAGENRQLSYSVSASQAAGDAAYTASGQYHSAYSSVSASASTGSGYSQQSLGATGGLVVHQGGITLSNQMTDTFAIVEAPGAAGARVTNSTGTVINSSGFAVLPFLLPYRMNSISIDPESAISPDIEFKSTTSLIAPRLNAVVLIRFQTVGGRAILISARLTDGTEVPFGASIYDSQGSEVGLAGQDGRIYLRGIAEAGALTARWGDAPEQQCAFTYQLPGKQKDDGPFVRIDASCKAITAMPAGQK